MPVLIPCSRLVNIAVGVFMVLGGISNFFTGTWSSFILGAYAVVFGLGRSLPHSELTTSIGGANIILVVGGLEFLPNVPDYAYRYASFLFSFLGRGVCKLFSFCTPLDQRGKIRSLISSVNSLHLHRFHSAARPRAAHH